MLGISHRYHIPLRVLHLNELAIFFVGSDVDPPQWRFTTSAGPLVIQTLAVEERAQFRHKSKTVVGTSSRNEQSGNSDASAPSGASTASSPHTSVRTVAFDPWANWKPSTMPASTPSNPLAARVERLEKQMSGVTNDVKDLRKDQIATNAKLETMQAENAEGFRSLMQAIQEMKMPTSTSSTPVKSPPAKLSRKS